MNVYQLLRHEYSSDDGHYEVGPDNDYVYANEADAINLRDSFNRVSVADWNASVERHAPDTWTDPWQRGRTLNRTQYIARNSFDGDVTDADAIERFACRSTSLTYFTVRTLRVLK